MAKKKSNKKKNSARDQAENIQEQGNEGANVENMNEENKNMQNTRGVIVLGIFMHCQGCADTITKHLRGFDGVEEIEIDLKNHKVTVKGKTVDPERIAEWLRKRSNKHISLISPTLKGREEEKNEEVVEVVLKIYMHCEGCAADIKYNIHKMQGVFIVETDMKNSQVIVKGAFDPKKLVDFISRRVGKNAVVVKQTPPERKEGDKGKKGNKNEMEMDQIYPTGHVYAPDRILSEENPNACSVM